MEIELTAENFENVINSAEIPAVVQFRASWDEACASLAPIFSIVAEKFQEKATFSKVNIDNEIALTTKYGVTSLPTVIVFVGGEEKERTVGFVSETELEALIEKYTKDI